jgi:hypothetical protein
MSFGLKPSFNEPETNDTTSAPSETVPAPKKKKKPFALNVRNPGALAGAIARAKRARPSAMKYGN